jgi:uncharacterized protein (DUF885 family)
MAGSAFLPLGDPNKETLLQGFRDLQKRINGVLPTDFDIFPKADCEVKEVPSFMAQGSASARGSRRRPSASWAVPSA